MSDKTESSPTGKGRPTPKRRDAEARRGGPVAAPPSNRKEAARQLREKQTEQRKAVRKGNLTGNLTGNEKLLLPRDRGPERRLVRDLVDARRSLGFLLLPGALVVVVAGFTGNVRLQAITFGIWLAVLLGVAFDLLIAGFQIAKALNTQTPGGKKRGHIAYGLLRTTVIRRFRAPRPMVDRGTTV